MLKKESLKEPKVSFLTKEQESQIEAFKKTLLEKNQKINLVSRKNPEQKIDQLSKESLLAGLILKPFFKKKNQKVLDIGSGGGFPGLFFAILFPQNKFYLCERRRNKAEALKWLSSQCQLSNTEVLCQSAEELRPDYDLILSQAGMPQDKLTKLLKKLLKDQRRAFVWISQNQIPPSSSVFEIEKLKNSHPKKHILQLRLR